VVVDGLERVEEADRLVLGERDLSLIGEHVCCSAPEEVAQRLADRDGGRLVDGPLLVSESKFKSLSTHAHSVWTPYGITSHDTDWNTALAGGPGAPGATWRV
jgi:hypothetical protein